MLGDEQAPVCTFDGKKVISLASNNYLGLRGLTETASNLSRRLIAARFKGKGGGMATDRITIDPQVMGGKPCIRGMRVTVGMIVGMLAEGHTAAEVLQLYPYLEAEDIAQALSYAALRSEEREIELNRA